MKNKYSKQIIMYKEQNNKHDEHLIVQNKQKSQRRQTIQPIRQTKDVKVSS